MKKSRLLWGIPIGFINGFFASGGGIIAVLVLQKFFSLDEKKAHATSILIILPLTISGLLVYSLKGFTDIPTVIKTASGAALGALIGAKLLSKLSGKFIRIGFGGVMVLASLRMIFGG